jgi:hypothetical protein
MKYLSLFLLGIFIVAKTNTEASEIAFSALLGGGGDSYSEETSSDAAVDSNGNIYIIGNTQSSDFPATPSGSPCFVTKLSPAGAILYSVGLPGMSGRAIAVNDAGEVVIAGETGGGSFPGKNAMQPAFGGQTDAFVAKLGVNGELLFATFYGGSNIEVALGIAMDHLGNIYVTGFTESDDLPLTANAPKTALGGNHDAFLLKLSADGSRMLISTYMGGAGYDIGTRVLVALDSASVYVAGRTSSTNFVGSQTVNVSGHGVDAFVARFDPDTGKFMQMAFIGGTGREEASGLAVDNSGSIYICGETTSIDFPTTPNAAQPLAGGGTDLFVVKVGADLQAPAYSTCLGTGGDEASAALTQYLSNAEGSFLFSTTRIAVDNSGSAYVASSGEHIDFPARFASGAPAFQVGTARNAFVAKLSPSGAEVDGVISVGSSAGSQPRGIAVTGGTVLITGQTGFAPYPPFFATTPGAFNGEYKGNVADIFISRLSFAHTDPAHPAPPNDNRASATRIDGIARTFVGSNIGATPEPDGSESAHAGSPAAHSVWWTYTAAENGFLLVTTLGSTFDTVLTVYASNLDNLTGILAENDDLPMINPTTASGVKIPVQPGVVYDFAVDGKNEQTGDIAFSMVFSNAENDDFESRKPIDSFPLTVSGSNRRASRQFDEPFQDVAGRNSVWWEWTAPVSQSVRFSTKGSSFPALLAVYSGSVRTQLTRLSSISGGNDLSLGVQAGAKYEISVDGEYGQTGDIVLLIDQGQPPENDDFIHATLIPGTSAEIAASNLAASLEPGEQLIPTLGGGRTVWWSWTAPTNGLLTVTAINAGNPNTDRNTDTDLMIFTGTALANLQGVATNDDLSITPRILDARVSIEVETSRTYYIRVDNDKYGTQGGPFTLTLAFTRPPKILPGVSIQGGFLVFKGKGLAGKIYQAQISDNLRDWTDLPGDYVGEDLTVTLPIGTAQATFFRLVDKSQ